AQHVGHRQLRGSYETHVKIFSVMRYPQPPQDGAWKVVVHLGAAIPARRRRGRSGSGGQTSRSFSRWVLHLGCLPPDPLRGKFADVTGYPLPPRPFYIT
ncbi:MAG: hypothetical protein WBF76_14105, partial [Pseudonocardiaceae bacterium]